MRIQHAAVLAITVAVSTVFVGCLGKVRYPTYYELHLPPPPDPPPGPQARANVGIREFRPPGYLRQGPLVYRASAEQIGFYSYHRWATDPRDFVTSAIADRLRASGNFAEVKIYGGRSSADYIISGRLERLEEGDYKTGVKAEVALSAEMTDLRKETIVWANNASETARVAQHNGSTVLCQ